ncbi:N-acetylmuramoyl-L-alanine amidase [Virgibacillus kimchii]
MKLIKIGIALSGLLLILSVFPTALQAGSGETFIVGTDSLVMKEAPYQESNHIGYLNRGDRITIFEEKNGWGKSYFKGEPIWVALYFLIPVDQVDREEIDDKHKDKEEVQSANPVTVLDENGKEITISTEWKSIENNRKLSGSTEIANHEIGQTLADYHFMIDAGHGGKDAGALGLNSVKEKDLTLSTTEVITEKLEGEGATVSLTREDDSFISLDERVHMSNSSNANVFISIHYDGHEDSGANGLTTFYSSSVAKDLARTVQSSVHEKLNLADRGAKQNGYYVLRHNNKPAILLELGFITNANDLEAIQTSGFEEKVADGLINGLKEYFQD